MATLGSVRGACAVRMRNPRAIGLGALDHEIREATAEVIDRFRLARNRKVYASDVLSLVADLDLYDIPAGIGEIVLLERLDLGAVAVALVPLAADRLSDRAGPGSIVISGTEGDIVLAERSAGSAYAYTLHPGNRLQLHDMPRSNAARGLRVTHLPRPAGAVLPDDHLPVPDEVGYAVEAATFRRLTGVQGVQWNDPKAIERFVATAEERLINWLEPADLDPAGTPILDNDHIYLET